MKHKDDNEKDLGNVLNAYQVKPADMAMQQRILAVPVRNPRVWRELLDVLGGWRIAGPAFALSVSLGICTPLILGQQSSTISSSQDSVWTVAGLDTSQDWTYE
ncbi:MAG: hypothetical protein ACSHXK_05990 [Oceanococcus sp.]